MGGNGIRIRPVYRCTVVLGKPYPGILWRASRPSIAKPKVHHLWSSEPLVKVKAQITRRITNLAGTLSYYSFGVFRDVVG